MAEDAARIGGIIGSDGMQRLGTFKTEGHDVAKLDRSLIRHFELFQSIAGEDLDEILAVARARRIPKGISVFEQGEVAKEFYVLLDGRLKVFQISPGGEQLVVRFVTPGEIYGVAVALGRVDYPATAEAVVDSVTLGWDNDQWEVIVARVPAFALNTLRSIGHRVQEAHNRLRELSTEEVERRVARAILRLVDQSGRRSEGGVLIDFPISRQDIAQMTGTTLHSVSRILAAWEAAGWVEGGRQRVLVKQPHQLFMLAENTPDED